MLSLCYFYVFWELAAMTGFALAGASAASARAACAERVSGAVLSDYVSDDQSHYRSQDKQDRDSSYIC